MCRKTSSTNLSPVYHCFVMLGMKKHFFEIRGGVYTTRAKRGSDFPLYSRLGTGFVLADFLKSLAQFLQVVVMLLFVCVSQFVSCCYTFLVG
jgi:hypothetical protein